MYIADHDGKIYKATVKHINQKHQEEKGEIRKRKRNDDIENFCVKMFARMIQDIEVSK
jgi:hypothetical protein